MFVHVLFSLSVVQVLFVRAGRHYDDAIQTYNMDGLGREKRTLLMGIDYRSGLGREKRTLLMGIDYRSGLGREKRTLLMGIDYRSALGKLLKNARKTYVQKTSGRVKETTIFRYSKQGDIETALRDFYSVSPRDVRKPNSVISLKKGNALYGRVGDKRIRLFEKGNKAGNPVVEVTLTAPKPGEPNMYRIEYKKVLRKLKRD